MRPLFERYERLGGHLPHVALAELPTPVEPMARLGAELGLDRLFVKRDDLTGRAYGGNKVRKLEFVLGRALADGARAVLTFGCVGSNHALATALYAEQVGLERISMLFPQPNAHAVRRNVLRGYLAGARLEFCASEAEAARRVREQFREQDDRHGKFPTVIATGGSSPTGTLGFVNAAFELREQVEAGLLPEPDVIYVPSGTMGTCVGLLLGLKAAGLRTRIEAVAVTAPPYSSAEKAPVLFRVTNALLREADPNFPDLAFPEADFRLRHGFLGERYALFTEAAMAALRRVKDAEGLKLEGTYTGKTFAALLADAEAGALAGKTVLFWDTYSSRDFSDEIQGIDYHVLPEPFHRYFEEDVQPLDRPP